MSLGRPAATLPRDARLHPEPDRLHARPADDRLVRDRLRRRSGRRLPLLFRLAKRAGEDRDILGNGIIIVAIAALIGGRAYHVIDQWDALYKNDPVKIFLPPYSGLGVYGGIITGTIAGVPVHALQAGAVPALGGHRRPGPVRDAGDRPLGQLLQPGAVRVADDAAVGHPDRMRPPHRGLTRATPYPVETTRFQPLFLYESISGAIGALVLIWIGYHLRKRLRPGDLLLVFFVWYGLTRFFLETLRHDNWTFFGVPTAQIVSLAFVDPGASLILMWRHRGRPIDDDPPTFPAVATWGAIGRPVDRTRWTTTRRRRGLRRRSPTDDDVDDRRDDDDADGRRCRPTTPTPTSPPTTPGRAGARPAPG